ncbi:hypothetical protein S7711_10493 [Stachybotrys chartarum IBT 7711]|uniref:Uncharacterized protein n=1 Tax=Stachybotrys chartarum (strain CBS 109288 / IBT 7711) TaxID=1280523 RepID=A0A084BCB0_STACB|nr:hypothetical protein S7711_10493 [Stachybotrys chartarum IBT 7711]
MNHNSSNQWADFWLPSGAGPFTPLSRLPCDEQHDAAAIRLNFRDRAIRRFLERAQENIDTKYAAAEASEPENALNAPRASGEHITEFSQPHSPFLEPAKVKGKKEGDKQQNEDTHRRTGMFVKQDDLKDAVFLTDSTLSVFELDEGWAVINNSAKVNNGNGVRLYCCREANTESSQDRRASDNDNGNHGADFMADSETGKELDGWELLSNFY